MQRVAELSNENGLFVMAYKDYTIKAKLEDMQLLERRLREINAVFVGVDHQVDHYFETLSGKLKWREGTIEKLITHYERVVEQGVERTIVYRYDLNPSDEEINELRLRRQIATIRKLRKIYLVGNVKIHLDQLPDGQQFVEIEAIDRNNAFRNEDLRNQCLATKSRLGIPDEDMIPTGYLT